MRRRGIGIQGLKKKQNARSHFKQMGEQLTGERIATMEEQMEKFRKALEDFAFSHKEDIKGDPIFRKHFHEMCASIGVDPLASNKGKPCEQKNANKRSVTAQDQRLLLLFLSLVCSNKL